MRRGHKYSLSHIHLFCSYVSFKAAKKHKQRWRIHNVVIFSIAMQCTQMLINQFLWENFHTYTASDRIHSYTERRVAKLYVANEREIMPEYYSRNFDYVIRYLCYVFTAYCLSISTLRQICRKKFSTYSYIARGLRLSKGGVALP